MKLTPTAIRQHSFETAFRGYEKKEVSIFLDELSEIVDKLHQENLELKSKLQNTEFEAKRLKDVEDSLFRTLKTAEDTGASIIEEANEAADLIIAEANHTAEHASEHANKIMAQALKQAEEQAGILILAAEKKAKDTILELRQNLEILVSSYENLTKQRDDLVVNLRKLTQEGLNQIEKSEENFNQIDANALLEAIIELEKSNHFVVSNTDLFTQKKENLLELEVNPLEDASLEMELEKSESNELIDSNQLEQAPEIELIENPTEGKEENQNNVDKNFHIFQLEGKEESEPIADEVKPIIEEKQVSVDPLIDLTPKTEQSDEVSEERKNQSGSFFDEVS